MASTGRALLSWIDCHDSKVSVATGCVTEVIGWCCRSVDGLLRTWMQRGLAGGHLYTRRHACSNQRSAVRFSVDRGGGPTSILDLGLRS